MGIVDKNIDAIKAVCKKYYVKKLFAVGSVVTNKFSSKSDVDLLVQFSDINAMDYAENYFQLKSALQNIFTRDIDLLEEIAIKNPYLKQSMNSTKKLIYGLNRCNFSI